MGNSGGTSRTAPLQRRKWVFRLTVSILCAGGVLLMGSLLTHYTNVYFTPEYPPTVNRNDILVYDVTAAICLTVLGAALIVALMGRRWVLAGVAGLLLVVGVVIAVEFSVPEGRWIPVPAASESLPSNHQLCHSGSDDCVGA